MAEPNIPNIEKTSFETLKNNLHNLVEDMGNVRHPKRCVKVYARREKRDLWVDSKGNTKDGMGIVYINTKDEVVALSSDEAKMLSRFKDEWIQFGFLEDKSYYVYDKTDYRISMSGDGAGQKEKFGAFGFVKVNDLEVEINKNLKEFELLNLNKHEMLSCSFGYNYSQPTMGFNITISNKRGERKDLIHSGDLVKIYMWYDRPGDSEFQKLIEDWMENKDIDKEDEKTNKLLDYKVYFPSKNLNDSKAPPKGDEAVAEKMGINLMFTGIIDDTCYEYDKSSGNRITFTGRSLGSVLTSARVYKSYPLPNRLKMSHEEVIYDMVSKQTNLPIGTLALSNGDWSKGILGDPTKRIQTFEYYKNSTAGKDLKTISKEEAEQSIHDRYENEITEMFLTAGKMEDIKNIEGIVKLSDDFIKAIMDNNVTVSDKSNPPNKGENYKLSEESNIQVAELKDSGYTGPLWIYSDGKVGKDNNAGFPDGTSLKSIVELLTKLNRKQYVELLPEKWAEYGIKIPADMTRKEDTTVTTVKPIRLFFATGWGCVKYVLQERVITTSAERATMIYAIREFAQAKETFENIKFLAINSPDEFRVNYSPIKSNDFSLYEVPDNFDVIRFALSLNIISASEVVSELGYNDIDPNNGKTYEEKIEDGEYDGKDAMVTNIGTTDKNKRTKRVQEDQETKVKKYLLIEEAIKKEEDGNLTYVDAILRIKMFYQKIRQYTRAFHDSMNQHECRSWYANTDAVKVPMDTAKFKKAAINFPICKKGEIIVIPKNLTNAPRTWKVLTKVKFDFVAGKYKTNLKNDIEAILIPYYFENKDKTKVQAYKQDKNKGFSSIITDESKDKIDTKCFKLYKSKKNAYTNIDIGEIKVYGRWASVPNLWTITIELESVNDVIIDDKVILEFTVNEDEELMKELRKENKDIAFEGDTIDEAIKKITSKHLDIVNYVDEYGLFHVRPRFAYKLAGQRREYLLKTGGKFFPRYFSGRINENTSQLINQVIVMGISPGNSELMVVTINDKESIAKYGLKKDFQKISKIDDVIEAIKRAKSVLISNRMKIREAEITCEPMFDLRPGHIIHVEDASSGLGGSFIVDTIGINYGKSGGATQSIKAFTFNNKIIDTSQLEGQVVYYSKKPGSDSLSEDGTQQLSGDQISGKKPVSKEIEIKNARDAISKSKK